MKHFGGCSSVFFSLCFLHNYETNYLFSKVLQDKTEVKMNQKQVVYVVTTGLRKSKPIFYEETRVKEAIKWL